MQINSQDHLQGNRFGFDFRGGRFGQILKLNHHESDKN